MVIGKIDRVEVNCTFTKTAVTCSRIDSNQDHLLNLSNGERNVTDIVRK